jgi:hypothetical protein
VKAALFLKSTYEHHLEVTRISWSKYKSFPYPARIKSISFSRLERFAVGPSLTNIVNIATCDPTLYQAVGRYRTVVPRNATKDNPALFYTVGVVRHSDLFTGESPTKFVLYPAISYGIVRPPSWVKFSMKAN